MKILNSFTKWALTLAVTALSAISLSAQPPQGDGQPDGKNSEFWKKAQAEKQDFIVRRLELSKAEKKAFLKVYKENEEQRGKLFEARQNALKALKGAVDSEEEVDIQPLLQAYLDARTTLEEWENNDYLRFADVLPQEKIAVLLVAEEDFRKAQIHRLGGRRQGGAPGQGGPGQGGPGGQGGFGGGRPPMGGGPGGFGGGMPF